jgi:DUF2939 family protein
MRRALGIAGLLVLVVVAFIFWPITGFYRLASAVDSKDPGALAKAVDFPHLRKSLTKQIVQTYLELSDKRREKQKAPKLTMMERSLALGAGNSIAEPIVAQLIDDDTLLELLTEGRIRASGKNANEYDPPATLAPLGEAASWSGWQLWLTADHRITDVVTYVPPGKPRDEQFRASFMLSDWRWKLAGLELPQNMRMQLVKEVLAEQKRSGE